MSIRIPDTTTTFADSSECIAIKASIGTKTSLTKFGSHRLRGTKSVAIQRVGSDGTSNDGYNDKILLDQTDSNTEIAADGSGSSACERAPRTGLLRSMLTRNSSATFFDHGTTQTLDGNSPDNEDANPPESRKPLHQIARHASVGMEMIMRTLLIIPVLLLSSCASDPFATNPLHLSLIQRDTIEELHTDARSHFDTRVGNCEDFMRLMSSDLDLKGYKLGTDYEILACDSNGLGIGGRKYDHVFVVMADQFGTTRVLDNLTAPGRPLALNHPYRFCIMPINTFDGKWREVSLY